VLDGTIALKWRLAFPGIGYFSTPMSVMWLFAHVYGGGVDDIAPGLEKIKEMKESGNLIFWNDVNEFLNLMKTGEVDMGMYWDGRIWGFHDDGNQHVGYINPAPGSVASPNVTQKVKNAPDLAWQFIDVTLEAGPQACWANAIPYAMSNKNIKYADKIAPRITKVSETLWPPFDKAGEKKSEWVELWNKEIGR